MPSPLSRGGRHVRKSGVKKTGGIRPGRPDYAYADRTCGGDRVFGHSHCRQPRSKRLAPIRVRNLARHRPQPEPLIRRLTLESVGLALSVRAVGIGLAWLFLYLLKIGASASPGLRSWLHRLGADGSDLRAISPPPLVVHAAHPDCCPCCIGRDGRLEAVWHPSRGNHREALVEPVASLLSPPPSAVILQTGSERARDTDSRRHG